MVLHDLRYGLRLILRHPSFAVIAIVTLAVGIGANTAIFAVVDRVVLRAVPFPDPDRLVVVWETNPNVRQLEPHRQMAAASGRCETSRCRLRRR